MSINHTRKTANFLRRHGSHARLVLTSSPAHAETAMEHLQAEPRPMFKEGHTLLPLSRWGWSLPVETSVELCEHWGFALELKSKGPV